METVIVAEQVSKRFDIHHNRAYALKTRLLGMVYKRYRPRIEDFWALRDVSLTIGRGEAVGLVGRNGSGKSTLLKLIAGIHRPTSGRVLVRRGAKIGTMIELGVGFHPELSGRENVYLNASVYGLSRADVDRIYDAVVDYSEIAQFIDEPIKNYSSGMVMRLAFAVAAHLDPEVLLLDEIFAVGDEAFQAKCRQTMKQFIDKGRTVVFVSHSADVRRADLQPGLCAEGWTQSIRREHERGAGALSRDGLGGSRAGTLSAGCRSGTSLCAWDTIGNSSCMPSSPAAPASSAAPSSIACSPMATTSSPTTTSPPASASSSPRALTHPRFTLVEGDTLDLPALTRAMAGRDVVFHLAANADVRFGTEHPRKDLEQNTIATFNVLEAMRANGVRRIAFSSTGSVYGEAHVFPTPEDAPFPVQTSLYGASKLAGEGLIQAYCEGFGFQGCIFRFVSILGERYTHGHVFDFYRSLRSDPDAPARARQRPAAQVVPLRPGLPRRDAPRDREDAPTRSTSSTSAPTSTAR